MQYIDTVPVASKRGTALTRNGELFQTTFETVRLIRLTPSGLMSKLRRMYGTAMRDNCLVRCPYTTQHGINWMLDCLVLIEDLEGETIDVYVSSVKLLNAVQDW